MLSNRLKSLRMQHRKTQQEIADFLGISRQGYAKYENNLGEPDNSTLSKLGDYFKVSTDYLLGRSNHPQLTAEKDHEVDAEVDELMKILEAMSPEERKEMEARILAYAQGLVDAKKNK
ncbi:helix-turn-helix transcriptional regulator [Metasolibacillus sp. FSL H7-0170]|uniref:helix-turn-helix domain-containing protein n=1 Tax=Metasolibacillus sp. FSL H7-0170 TaxID=2921431 RepID=UPI0031588399